MIRSSTPRRLPLPLIVVAFMGLSCQSSASKARYGPIEVIVYDDLDAVHFHNTSNQRVRIQDHVVFPNVDGPVVGDGYLGPNELIATFPARSKVRGRIFATAPASMPVAPPAAPSSATTTGDPP